MFTYFLIQHLNEHIQEKAITGISSCCFQALPKTHLCLVPIGLVRLSRVPYLLDSNL